MSSVVHFEIPADDTDRAVAFYTDVFGWKFQKWDGPMPYWLITTGPDGQPGINGGLLPRQCPGASTVNTVTVESVASATCAVKLKTNTGTIMMPPPTPNSPASTPAQAPSTR